MPDFDIVIVNYQSTGLTMACLADIRKRLASCTAQVWVEDNASTDHPGRIKAFYPAVCFHRNQDNIGFAAAVNQAIQKGCAPYILLLNPDTRMETDLFGHLVRFFQSHPNVAILGPCILNADGTLQASARAFPTPLTALFGRQSLLSRLFPQNRFTKANLLAEEIVKTRKPTPVDWVSGACMAVRREAVERAGGLDEGFFMYWEDADWCRRMSANGWQVVYDPRIMITHAAGKSSRRNPLRSALAFHRSAYRLYAKHYPETTRRAWPLIAGMLAVRFFAVAVFIVIGNVFSRKTS